MIITYAIQDREAGNLIEYCNTKHEAEIRLKEFERIDKEEGIYEPNFYEICEIEY